VEAVRAPWKPTEGESGLTTRSPFLGEFVVPYLTTASGQWDRPFTVFSLSRRQRISRATQPANSQDGVPRRKINPNRLDCELQVSEMPHGFSRSRQTPMIIGRLCRVAEVGVSCRELLSAKNIFNPAFNLLCDLAILRLLLGIGETNWDKGHRIHIQSSQ
jgi:hypothetical protein